MKIVHLLFSFTVGGAELLVTDLANYQSDKYKVWVIILNDHIDQSLIKMLSANVKVICIGRSAGSVNPIRFLTLFYHLRNIKPDILHCHHEAMIKLLPLFKSKKIITIHDVGRVIKNIEKYDVKVAISPAVYIDVAKRSKNKINPVVINNGIKADEIKNNSEYTFKGEIKIVQIGRLQHEKKGQDILIKAIAVLVNKYGVKNVTLSLVGEGLSFEYLRGIADDLKLNSAVSFMGLKDRGWIYNNLKDFSILVQPSRYEGFGLTVVEAMLAKVPCLVSNIDGPIDLIRNGEYGFSFKSGDIESCASALNEIITFSETELNVKVQNAYLYAKDVYSSKMMNENYIKTYLN